MNTSKNRNGFSLIEIVAALGLLGILLTVINIYLVSSLKNSRKALAVSIAQEEGNYVLNLITRDVRYARSVDVSNDMADTIQIITQDNMFLVYYRISDLTTLMARGSYTGFGSTTWTERLISENFQINPCENQPYIFKKNGRSVNICFYLKSKNKLADVTTQASDNPRGIKFQTRTSFRNFYRQSPSPYNSYISRL